MSGETTVGSIVGFLRLNITDFEAGIAKATAMADRLDGKDVDVKVKVDGTARAATELAAVDSAAKKTDGSVRQLDKSSNNMGRSARFLVGVLLTVGPALIPLAAATVGLAAGFGAMGVAGVLAVVGIRQEMKAGTTLGLTYTGMLQTLKGDLTTLGRTAASGTLQPFQQSVADLQRRMPALNSIVGEFSVITGKTAGVLATGLVAGFIAFAPLARDAGVYILTLTQRFATMMSGPGVVSFGDYVRSVFPQVMHMFETVVSAAIHLVAAFAPFGGGMLTLLSAFADAINAIPVDMLSKIATGGLAIFLAFRTFGLLSMPIHEISVAMRFMGISTEGAAAAMRTLTIAAGAIGVLIAVATILYTAHSESVRQNVQAANEYADALRTSNGVIDENIRQMTVKNLSDSGALAAARDLGLSLSLVTNAALGNTAALATVTATAKPFHDALILSEQGAGKSSEAITKNGEAANTLTTALGGTNTALKSGLQTYRDQAAATATSTAAITPAIAAHQALAAKLGITSAALTLVEDGQKKTADAAASAAAKMYLENDAAGILKNALDLLNGKAISAAQAQNSFDSSLSNMGDHLTPTGKKIIFTTKSIGDMSTASVALRGQLLGQVTSAQGVVESMGGLSESTGKARATMVTLRQQIINNAVAHGVDRAAVTAFIDKLMKIPKSVPPTKLDVDKAAAEAKVAALQAQINALRPGPKPKLGVDTWTAAAQIEALQRQIDQLHGKTVYTDVINRSVAAGYGPKGKAQFGPANGAILTGFAAGGIQGFPTGESHIAQIAPAGAMRLWAEPETGGEAYIPLAPSKRARSTAIWEETGRKLGIGGQGQSGPIELGPNTIRALGREIAARPMMLDGAQVSRNVDSRLVPR